MEEIREQLVQVLNSDDMRAIHHVLKQAQVIFGHGQGCCSSQLQKLMTNEQYSRLELGQAQATEGYVELVGVAEGCYVRAYAQREVDEMRRLAQLSPLDAYSDLQSAIDKLEKPDFPDLLQGKPDGKKLRSVIEAMQPGLLRTVHAKLDAVSNWIRCLVR